MILVQQFPQTVSIIHSVIHARSIPGYEDVDMTKKTNVRVFETNFS